MKKSIFRLPALIVMTGSAIAAPAAAKDGAWLTRQITNAGAGAVIELPPGDYEITDLKVRNDLTLVGPEDRSAVLYSAEVTDKGLLVPLTGVSLTVRNITFRDANSWSRNGAGIRHEGRDLTVVNCLFDNNEDGILSTGDANGMIRIEASDFIDSGFGDGQSHAIYVLDAERLTVKNSTFRGTRIGHHIKSLARETTIEDTIMDDGTGRGSYAVDASRGGDLVITGSTMIQAADNDNDIIVNYDLSRDGARAGSIRIENNKVINRADGGYFLRVDAPVEPALADNEIVNEGKRKLKLKR